MTNNELDRLLDSALREYVAHEPPAGLAYRILPAENRRVPWMWMWVSGAAATACAAMVLMLPQTPALPVGPSAPAVAVAMPWTIPLRIARRLPTRPMDRFPGPAPLTVQERALLQFLEQDYEQALIVLDDRREDRRPEPKIAEEGNQ